MANAQKPKLSRHFPSSIKPVRVGFYRVKTPGVTANIWSYWNGKYWMSCTSHQIIGRSKSDDMYLKKSIWWGLANERS